MLRKTLGLFLVLLCEVNFSTTNPAYANADQWVTGESLNKLIDPAVVPADAIVEAEVATTDERLSPSQCPAPLFSNSEQRKAWGRTLLKVQCMGTSVAPFFVYVDFRIWSPVLVVKEQIQRGEAIGADQVEYRTMNLAELKQGWLTDVNDLDNKTAVRPLWPGTTLNHEALKGKALIQFGDTVKIMVQGPGFQIAGSGMAMERAEKGDVVKIKTTQGKVLHGVAVGEMLVEVTL